MARTLCPAEERLAAAAWAAGAWSPTRPSRLGARARVGPPASAVRRGRRRREGLGLARADDRGARRLDRCRSRCRGLLRDHDLGPVEPQLLFDPVEVPGEIDRSLRSLARVDRHRALEQPVEAARDVAPSGHRSPPVQDLLDLLAALDVSRHCERRVTHEQVPDGRRQRVDVGRRAAVGLRAEHLGWRPRHRHAQVVPALGQVSAAGDAEVGEGGDAVLVDQDVGGFDVSVDDAALVRCLDGAGQFHPQCGAPPRPTSGSPSRALRGPAAGSTSSPGRAARRRSSPRRRPGRCWDGPSRP